MGEYELSMTNEQSELSMRELESKLYGSPLQNAKSINRSNSPSYSILDNNRQRFNRKPTEILVS